MSRATGAPDRQNELPALAAGAAAAARSAFLYSLYPVGVCAVIAAGHPRWALAATCVVFGVGCALRPRRRLIGVALLLAAPFVGLSALAEFAGPLVYLPPVVLNLGIAALFARTLGPGREPMISMFARAERGVLEPDLARYTRTLTMVWVAFFVGAAVLSAALAASAPPAVWGAWVAVGNQVAAGSLFVGEYLYRRSRFAHYRHASPLALAALVAARWRAEL